MHVDELIQEVQAAAVPAGQQGEDVPLWAVLLKWAAILLAAAIVGILLLRQILRARYRKRRQLMARKRVLTAPPPQRPRPPVGRVIDVTVQKDRRNRIYVIPPEEK